MNMSEKVENLANLMEKIHNSDELKNEDSKSIDNGLLTIDSSTNINEKNVQLSNQNSLISSLSPQNDHKRLHRVVFTGGPCAGKTTSMNKIRSFFENIGWKVLVVPETAYTLLSSGIRFYELDTEAKIQFQENLLKTLLQIEDTINDTAKYYTNVRGQNCLVIYDRGAMDPVSYLEPNEWEQLKLKNADWNEVDLRDNRYDQIIHLVTAANGAEEFYTLDNNITRTETIEKARELDENCSKIWIGHPCMDIIDNCYLFERKVAKALQVVCDRIGLKLKGFDAGNKKRKFLVKELPDDSRFPNFQELNVVHNYLITNSNSLQVRIRKCGQGGIWSYSYATRTYEGNQLVETRTRIDRREYSILTKTIDTNHWTVYHRRRGFIWRNRCFKLEIYEEPCDPKCRGLILLSTRTTDEDLLLPDFISIEKEVTNEVEYSMFNLSLKTTKK